MSIHSTSPPHDACLKAPDALLLAATAPHVAFDLLSADFTAGDFPWFDAMQAAAENRVGGLVARLLESEPLASRVSETVRADWRALRMLQVFRIEAAARQLREIAAALAEVGVVPLLYKGLDFHERLYDEEQPRAFSDLDLVVRPEQVEPAVAALTRSGYVPHYRGLPLWFHRRFHLHAVFAHPHHRRPLELHWALDSPYSDQIDPTAQVFAAARTCEAFGPNVLRPVAIDALVLMAIHLEKHIGLCALLDHRRARLGAVLETGGLVWVVDVARWMRMQPEAQRGADVLGRIRELHAERAVTLSLRLAEDLDPGALPGWARERAERLPHGRSALRSIVYPDLARRPAATERGRRRRRALLTMRPVLGFRPIRVLEALLPRHFVPGTDRSWRSWWALRAPRHLARMAAELAALAAVRFGQRRQRARALRAPATSG